MAITLSPKDPSERVDYDWSPALDAGDLLTGSPTVNVVLGTATVDTSSLIDGSTKVRIWLVGGTAGETVAIEVRVSTTAGRIWEETLFIPIKNSADQPTEADEIRAILVQINAAITARINGTAVREAWRDGRRIIRETMSMTELLNLQQYYERKLEQATLAATGGRRRRAIPIGWAV